MIQELNLSDEEKLRLYKENCTFDELAKMHIELEKHMPPPKYIEAGEQAHNTLQVSISLLDDALFFMQAELLTGENIKKTINNINAVIAKLKTV